MRDILRCTICGGPLSGGLDTYGDAGHELCWHCYEYGVMPEEDEDVWYGLGPHRHDLSITGSIIGSTVLDPLPERNSDGEYEIEPGLFFSPDDDAPGLGVWRQKR